MQILSISANVWLFFKTQLKRGESSSMATFDLVVEGHCGIHDALPIDSVENSARHREAHDAEDGLHEKKQRCMSKCGTVHEMYSHLQNNDKY